MPRSDRPRLTDEEYRQEIEALASEVVAAAIEEESFDVYLDDGPKTRLQEAITRLAQNLRHDHFEGDGCIPEEEV